MLLALVMCIGAPQVLAEGAAESPGFTGVHCGAVHSPGCVASTSTSPSLLQIIIIVASTVIP